MGGYVGTEVSLNQSTSTDTISATCQTVKGHEVDS